MNDEKRFVLIVHSREEEEVANHLSEGLREAGFTVHHRGMVLVGESFEAETLKILETSPPVVLCGTSRAVGAKWCRRMVHAARDRSLKLILLQMDQEADTESIAYGDRVAEYWKNPAHAMRELIDALNVHFPIRTAVPERATSKTKVNHLNYETRYRQALKSKYNMVELFGIGGLSEESKSHELSIAYVSLSLETNTTLPKTGTVLFESLLDKIHETSGRFLISGEAGSGKTTLLKWLAVEAAERGSSEVGLEFLADHEGGGNPNTNFRDWRRLVPLLIRLRDCPDGQLPSPEEMHKFIVKELGPGPPGWFRSILENGNAFVLIDGIDEIPEHSRATLQNNVKTFIDLYPKNVFMMTTRPAAVSEEFLAELSVVRASINPMSSIDKKIFISRWHKAVASKSRTIRGVEDYTKELAEQLIQTLETTPSVNRLATNPLLCAMICALHRDLDKRLPDNESELCDELIKLLLERRDQQISHAISHKIYHHLEYSKKRAIVRHLAHYMVLNEQSSIKLGMFHSIIKTLLLQFSNGSSSSEVKEDVKNVGQALLERSGLFREIQFNQIDFIHNTFKEYLSSEVFVSRYDIGYFLKRALDPAFQPVLLFAIRWDELELVHDIIRGLLNRATVIKKGTIDSEHFQLSQQYLMLAIRCRYIALRVPIDIQKTIDQRITSVFPPKNFDEAFSLAACGDPVVYLLKPHVSYPAATNAACIRTLRLIGTANAKRTLTEFFKFTAQEIVTELIQSVNPLLLPSILSIVRQGKPLPREVASQIVDLNPLRQVTDLKKLDLTHTRVEDLSPLSKHKHLQIIVLRSSEVHDVSSLRNILSLTHIDLTSTSVKDLSALSDVVNLKELKLAATKIEDIGALTNLLNLEWLELVNTRITSLEPLRNLANIRALWLFKTKIQTIEPLKNLTNLRLLDIACCDVSDLAPLERLQLLEKLWLDQGRSYKNTNVVKMLRSLKVLHK